jgi:hypothetical protein
MQLSRLEQMKTLASYGLAYLLWAVSLPLGGWVIYDLRDTILTIVAVITVKLTNGTRDVFYANLRLRAADTTSWLVVGAFLIAMIVLIENIYRSGASIGRLWSRFFLVLAVCFGLLGLFSLTNDLTRLLVDAFSWRGLFYPAVYGLVAVAFFWLSGLRTSKENLTPGR